MSKSHIITSECCLCHKHFRETEVYPSELVRPAISNLIRKDYPDWRQTGVICKNELNGYRKKYVESLLGDEAGELSSLEAEVSQSLVDHETITENMLRVESGTRSFGERVSDELARWGGSWTFIISFSIFIIVWMIVNSIVLLTRAFDPYPFILLNLVLSSLAAIQAPVIMMSQHRQETRDRMRAENDYRINLKAELEIRHLHEKIDHMLSSQWKRLVEIQEIQMDLMEELRKKSKSS
jgi:uncharacterized membrane protein